MLSVLLFLSVLIPTAHAQYLTPEDVLLSIPTNPRAAQQNASRQAAEAQNRSRPSVQEPGAQSSSSSAASSETLHPSPPVEETPVPVETLDPVTLRLLRRLQQRAHEGPPLPPSEVTQSTALHAGADLTGSGPAETATLAAIGLAVGVTLWRSRRLERFAKR